MYPREYAERIGIFSICRSSDFDADTEDFTDCELLKIEEDLLNPEARSKPQTSYDGSVRTIERIFECSEVLCRRTPLKSAQKFFFTLISSA